MASSESVSGSRGIMMLTLSLSLEAAMARAWSNHVQSRLLVCMPPARCLWDTCQWCASHSSTPTA